MKDICLYKVYSLRAEYAALRLIFSPRIHCFCISRVSSFRGRYYMLKLELDTFYPQVPRKPYWLGKLTEHISDLRPKKLPIQEPQMMDVYKKIYGTRKALKFKVCLREWVNTVRTGLQYVGLYYGT